MGELVTVDSALLSVKPWNLMLSEKLSDLHLVSAIIVPNCLDIDAHYRARSDGFQSLQPNLIHYTTLNTPRGRLDVCIDTQTFMVKKMVFPLCGRLISRMCCTLHLKVKLS